MLPRVIRLTDSCIQMSSFSQQVEGICRSQMFIGKNASQIHQHLISLEHQVSYRSVLTFVKQEIENKSQNKKEYRYIHIYSKTSITTVLHDQYQLSIFYRSRLLGDRTKEIQELVKTTYQNDKRQSERQVINICNE